MTMKPLDWTPGTIWQHRVAALWWAYLAFDEEEDYRAKAHIAAHLLEMGEIP